MCTALLGKTCLLFFRTAVVGFSSMISFYPEVFIGWPLYFCPSSLFAVRICMMWHFKCLVSFHGLRPSLQLYPIQQYWENVLPDLVVVTCVHIKPLFASPCRSQKWEKLLCKPIPHCAVSIHAFYTTTDLDSLATHLPEILVVCLPFMPTPIHELDHHEVYRGLADIPIDRLDDCHRTTKCPKFHLWAFASSINLQLFRILSHR